MFIYRIRYNSKSEKLTNNLSSVVKVCLKLTGRCPLGVGRQTGPGLVSDLGGNH